MISKRLILLVFSIWLAACNRAPESREAVRQGVLDHLGKNSGLDLNSMSIDVSKVSFEGNIATATVSFKPKSSPDAGMSMNYKLERQGTKWIVQKAANSGGHGGVAAPQAAPSPSGDLPAGHPPVGGGTGATSELPSGHPPVAPHPEAPKSK